MEQQLPRVQLGSPPDAGELQGHRGQRQWFEECGLLFALAPSIDSLIADFMEYRFMKRWHISIRVSAKKQEIHCYLFRGRRSGARAALCLPHLGLRGQK